MGDLNLYSGITNLWCQWSLHWRRLMHYGWKSTQIHEMGWYGMAQGKGTPSGSRTKLWIHTVDTRKPNVSYIDIWIGNSIWHEHRVLEKCNSNLIYYIHGAYGKAVVFNFFYSNRVRYRLPAIYSCTSSPTFSSCSSPWSESTTRARLVLVGSGRNREY